MNKNQICLAVKTFGRLPFISALCSSSSLVTLSVREMRIIRLRNHISVDSSPALIFLLTVQVCTSRLLHCFFCERRFSKCPPSSQRRWLIKETHFTMIFSVCYSHFIVGSRHTYTYSCSVCELNRVYILCIALHVSMSAAYNKMWITNTKLWLYKKLRYREEHSASVVLSWYTLWHLSGDKQQINSQSTTCTKLAMKPTEFRDITRNNGHYNVQGRSRSPILVPLESPYTTSY